MLHRGRCRRRRGQRERIVIRVLLAEDHETVREGLRLLVNAQPDMQVVAEVSDGRAAVAASTTLKPDVVVLDLSMPVMGGLSAARALKQATTTARSVAPPRHADDPSLPRP